MATVIQNLSGTVRAPVFNGTQGTGAFVGDGSSLTSLTRANVAADAANSVVINSGAGLLSSETRLATSRGGHGALSMTLTPPYTYWNNFVGNVRPTDAATVEAVVPAIVGATTGVFNPLAASVNPVPDSLVLRNGSGDIGDMHIISQHPTTNSNITLIGPSAIYDIPIYVRTLAAGSANALIITPEAANSGAVTLDVLATINRRNTPESNGTLHVTARVRYVLGTNTWTQTIPFLQDERSLESDLTGANISLDTSGGSAILVANGNASNVLDWTIKAHVVYQRTLAV